MSKKRDELKFQHEKCFSSFSLTLDWKCNWRNKIMKKDFFPIDGFEY